MQIRYTSQVHVIHYIHSNLYFYNMEQLGMPCEMVNPIRSPYFHAIAAYDDQNQLLGGLVYRLTNQGKTFFGEFFFLNPNTRSGGIGSRIIREAIQWAGELHCEKIELTTNSFQAPGFYKKMGFQEISAKKDPVPNFPENMHYDLEYIL